MKHKKLKVGTIVEIIKSGNRFNAWDKDGNKLTSHIRTGTRRGAYAAVWHLNCERVRVVVHTGGKYR